MRGELSSLVTFIGGTNLLPDSTAPSATVPAKTIAVGIQQSREEVEISNHHEEPAASDVHGVRGHRLRAIAKWSQPGRKMVKRALASRRGQMVVVACFVIVAGVVSGGLVFDEYPKNIPILSPFLTAVGLFIAFLTWQANVYRKEWKESRERLLSYIRDCLEVLEQLAHDPEKTLQDMKSPPFQYSLRSYSHNELRGDLAMMHGKTVAALWNKDYTEGSVFEAAAAKMYHLTYHWRAAHGFSAVPDQLLTNRELRLLVGSGHQKLCQFEQAVLAYDLCGPLEGARRHVVKIWAPKSADNWSMREDRYLHRLSEGGMGDPTHVWMDS